MVPSEGILEEYDPWEPFNEKMFSFNYNMDKYVLKPVAKGYNFVMPDRLQQMIDSGFDNLLVVQRVVNNLLQWRPKGAGAEVGRFLINSTLGHRRALRHRQAGVRAPEDPRRLRADPRHLGPRPRPLPGAAAPAAAHRA